MEIPQITIKSMRVGEFEVSVPRGLSELLNDAGVWTTTPRNSLPICARYEREIIKRDGNIVTHLKLKKR
ncbi:MAG: hypothetical protein Q8934_14410 [Bacillota bacterium]|nr:hypothetical protein [Bacillota bacterium]